ncbi:8083_t:CDS:2 [Gigaspora margarita]|uniref:8083_t:CDS:1 n=1 Tax=Gigaspora margarita TaxID=4874 RepID=A0ABN7V1W2_GIGMA|nr:8083_t:CDS:2 [Gigaspora margarita]
MSQPNPETGPKTGNQEDIEVIKENDTTEISNEEMQIDEKMNKQQDNEYTGNEQVEEKRLYSQAERQLVSGENTRSETTEQHLIQQVNEEIEKVNRLSQIEIGTKLSINDTIEDKREN